MTQIEWRGSAVSLSQREGGGDPLCSKRRDRPWSCLLAFAASDGNKGESLLPFQTRGSRWICGSRDRWVLIVDCVHAAAEACMWCEGEGSMEKGDGGRGT